MLGWDEMFDWDVGCWLLRLAVCLASDFVPDRGGARSSYNGRDD